MFDHLPIEIQIEIMKMFPVKSLIQFRSVSKPWKSLIDSSRFVSHYNLRQTQPHLFIVYEDAGEGGLKYVSIIDDDDNFPEQLCDVSAIVPIFVIQENKTILRVGPTLVGSSQGLLCLDACSDVYIWNPCIRKSVTVKKLDIDYHTHERVLGFGVCPKTCHPKLVQVTLPQKQLEMKTWQVSVYSLRSKIWRTRSFSKINDLLCESIELSSCNECVDGFIYWRSSCKDNCRRLIISFNLTNEEFGVIYLPDDFNFVHNSFLDLSKYRESLVLIQHNYKTAYNDYDVWMMEGGDTKSFKKLFTINSTADCVKVMAISYNGEAILEILENYWEENVASVDSYEPSSKLFKWTKITGIRGSTSMTSYKETLSLHDY